MIVSDAQRQFAAEALAGMRKEELVPAAGAMPNAQKSTKAEIARWIADNDYDLALELLSRKYA